MWKEDVMGYLGNSDEVRNNANKILTEILKCSNSLISIWKDGELIPAYRAIELHVFFSNKDNRDKYGLSDEHPVFDMYEYVDSDGKVKAFRLKTKGDLPIRTSIYKGEALSTAAIKILSRADKAKTETKKIGVLTRFIKGLI